MSLPQEQAGTHIRPPPRLLGLSLKVRFDGVVLSKLTWSLAERCRGLRATPSARCRDQHPTHLPVPFLSCYMQRRPFLVVGRVDVGPGPDHGLARAHVAVGSCDVQTGQALDRLSVDVGLCSYEDFAHLDEATETRRVERGTPLLIGIVNVGSHPKQHLAHRHVALVRGNMQRCTFLGGGRVDVGPQPNQNLAQLDVGP
eukprot:CAMPEP_0175967916 /NCGR_PEP_ID=MMETSP0108-20121206/39592_1 /TAXON_ID=195067 ORGANISM="Goniomonas pacifica, Strain CCMP1869" /NCGR_SAMPLE_ID=MMETSP0108 /ASSEMBLY_ACC=CAM_ASM_000204 /LENGTH=198 /DNA_ID=CAMNT_0017296481 /DNA_START=121 /DNA_END=717 /DNA_ORIENTATION=+